MSTHKTDENQMKTSKEYQTLWTGYHILHNEIYSSLQEILDELSMELSQK